MKTLAWNPGNVLVIVRQRLPEVDDISVIVEDAELSHAPGLVLQGSGRMDALQSLTFSEQFDNLVDPHITSRILRYPRVVALPKMKFYGIPAENQVAWPVGFAFETQLLVEDKGLICVQIRKDGYGLGKRHCSSHSILWKYGKGTKKGSAVETADRRRLLAI